MILIDFYIATRSIFIPCPKELQPHMTRTLNLNKTGLLQKANSNKYGKLPPVYSSTGFNYDDTFHRHCFIGIFCCLLVSSLAIFIPFFIGIGDHWSSTLNLQWSITIISTLRPATSFTCHTIIGITYHRQSSHRFDTVFFSLPISPPQPSRLAPKNGVNTCPNFAV